MGRVCFPEALAGNQTQLLISVDKPPYLVATGQAPPIVWALMPWGHLTRVLCHGDISPESSTMGTTKLIPCRTSLAASPGHLPTLSGLTGFSQTRHVELILVLKWLPLMFVAHLPYHEIHLWHKQRLRLFIKHQRSNYLSERSCSCGCLEIQKISDPGNCFFLIL